MFKKFFLVLTNLVVIYFETYLLTIKAKRLVIIFLNLTIGYSIDGIVTWIYWVLFILILSFSHTNVLQLFLTNENSYGVIAKMSDCKKTFGKQGK